MANHTPLRGPRIKPSVVDEEYKIRISKRINEFRDSDEQVLVFPKGLDNQERKYVHELCLKMGLLSKSTGTGESRYLTVRKPIESAAMNERLPVLVLHKSCQLELERYFASSPMLDLEVEYVTGRSSKPIIDNSLFKSSKRYQHRRNSDAVSSVAVTSRIPQVIASRKNLPIWKHQQEIIRSILESAVTIVSGETGSGKSTQTVQYVLDAFPGSRIVCTQPRRLSAMALADRIAEERGTEVGKEIGYSVRFESEYSSESRCVFCTTGVALSALRDGLGNSGLFKGVTHIFVDEVHERDRNTDFLLIFIKELLAAQMRPDWKSEDQINVKVVLMSATINVQMFYNYFSQLGVRCSTVAVEGSTFKVQPLFLEDALVTCKDFSERFTVTHNPSMNGEGGNMEKLLQASANKKLRCPLCGLGAKTVEEFGAHAATCQGSLGVASGSSSPAPRSESNSPAAGEWEDVWGVGAASTEKKKPPVTPAPADMENVWGDLAQPIAGRVEDSGMEDVWGDSATISTPVKRAPAAVVEEGANEEEDEDTEEDDEERTLMKSGITFDALTNKFRAMLVIGGQEVDLGTFDSKQAAEEKYMRAMGKWSSTMGTDEATKQIEEEEAKLIDNPPEAEGLTDAQAILDAYQISRQSEEEFEIDMDLVLALLEEIDKSGQDPSRFFSETLKESGLEAPKDDGASAILVFLPGWSEISALCDALGAHPRFGNERRYLVLPLHSGIPSKEQKRVFARPPPGVRKIICATNIAETSLTIEDVVYVVDCGFVKEKGYDAFTKSSSLLPHLVSKASARQRRGRAGRCRPGVCFHLYSRRRYEALLENQIPELLRTPLEEMCLHAKAIIAAAQPSRILPANTTVADFLLKALDPPSLKSILGALQSLVALGALDNEEQLTPLGQRLSGFPLEPRVGKMLLYGAYLGAVPQALTLSVASGFRDPFTLVTNPAVRARAAQIKFRMATAISELGVSDHVATLTAVKEFTKVRNQPNMDARRYCQENFLSYSTLDSLVSMQKQVAQQLSPAERSVRGAQEDRSLYGAVLSALICLATAPNLALFRGNKFTCATHKRIRPHQSSSVSPQRNGGGGRRDHSPDRFYVFEELCRNARGCTLRVVTEVNPIILVLFGGSLNLFDPSDEDSFRVLTNGLNTELRINSWARMLCVNEQDALRLAVLRLRLESMLIASLARGKFLPQDQAMASLVQRVVVAQLTGTTSSSFQGVPKQVPLPLLSTMSSEQPGKKATLSTNKAKSRQPSPAGRVPEDRQPSNILSGNPKGFKKPTGTPGNQTGTSKLTPAKASSAATKPTGRPTPAKDRPKSTQQIVAGEGAVDGSTAATPNLPTCVFCSQVGHTWQRGCAEFDALPQEEKEAFLTWFAANIATAATGGGGRKPFSKQPTPSKAGSKQRPSNSNGKPKAASGGAKKKAATSGQAPPPVSASSE